MWEIIAAVIAGIILAFLGFLYNQHRKAKKYYDLTWKNCSKLDSAVVLKERPFTKYYYERPTDNAISGYLNRNENVLIIGRPLSGKTRAAFQSLIKMNKSSDVIIPRCTDIDITDFFIPRHLKWWAKKYILLDDLQRLVEQQNFDHLLRKALQENLVIIATCRSEDEYKKAKCKMQEKNVDLESVFGQNLVEIKEISNDTAKDVADKNDINWQDTNFDGTIGSIFLPLREMERRFNGCDIKEKTILRAIKSLNTWGVYRGDLLFPIGWIIIVAGNSGLKGEEYEWHGWLEQLKGKEFLILKSGMVKIEEVYLEKIVKQESNEPELVFAVKMIDIFSQEPEALIKIGDHLSTVGAISLEKAAYVRMAIKAYLEALMIYTRERFPLDYAGTQNNLGIAFCTLSEVDDKSENCKLAIEAFKEALKIYAYERFPLDYARTQGNLGNAYRILAEVDDTSENCKIAIIALKEALKIYAHERFPLDYAGTQTNLGSTYRILAEVEDTSENCKIAIEAYKEALSMLGKSELPEMEKLIQINLQEVFSFLKES